MPRSPRPVATACMNGWVIPAPAPWAKTKHARAFGGRSRSAETEPALPISISSFCALAGFIYSNRYSLRDPLGHSQQRCHRQGLVQEIDLDGKASWLLVSDIADDLPAAVRLPAKHIEPGLFCFHRVRCAGDRHLERPDKSNDGEIARDHDLLDVERIGEFFRLVGQRPAQLAAQGFIVTFGKSALVV